MKLVVKLFHEILLKSKPVRKLLIKQLHYNLENILKPINNDIKVYRFWDKLEIKIPDSVNQESWLNIKDCLQCIPGIDFILKVDATEFTCLDHLADICVENFLDEISNQSFCVRIKRKGKHEFSSIDAEKKIGGRLLAKSHKARVDLHKPQITVKLEINGQEAYLVKEKISGLGGYPLGKQEAVLSLISGGFDSGVASYLMIKRGVKTHYCFFNLGGIAHEIGVKQVAYYIWKKFGSSHRVKFISVPFESVVEEILKTADVSVMGVLLKRMMLRAADHVAKDQGLNALVTGESIGQVSSQTITNLSAINSATDSLVIRPLITMDKQDIVAMAKSIGTEEFAANMPEYCGVISQKPSSKVKMEKVLASESKFDFSVLDNALANFKLISIEKVLDGLDTNTDVDV